VSSNLTETSPSNPDDDDLDWLFGEPEQDEIILTARRDHLALLAHSACDAMTDLIRLKARLQERGERARLCYVSDLKHYDGPQIIYAAAERYAGATVALVIEGFMERLREIQRREFLEYTRNDAESR
jgi:hypothetical protein